MNRRDFLKLAGIGTTTAGLAALVYRANGWWNQPAADGRAVLSAEESEIADSIARAMFPGQPQTPDGLPGAGDAEVEVVDHLDRYLDIVDGRTARLIRLLLHLIDDASIFDDFSLTRFRRRPLEERIAILRAWDDSAWMVRRRAFRGLKLILAGGYCSSHRVVDALDLQFKCGG